MNRRSKFLTSFWRVTLLQIAVLAAVFIPTLHAHSIASHGHGGEDHRHVVIHADFLTAAVHDHHATGEASSPENEGGTEVSQTSVAAATSRGFTLVPPSPEDDSIFRAVASAVLCDRLFPIILRPEQDHAPPRAEGFSSPCPPRAPPSVR